MKAKRNLEDIRYHLTGPIPSVKTPFNRDGSIDFSGLRKWVDFAIEAGSRTMLLTYGDSLYSILTDEEAAEVAKAVVEYTAGRAMVVAADRIWWTGKTVSFAKYCREVGADMLMVLPPDWAASCTVDTFVEHYAAAAEHIPVMVVTNVYIKRPADGWKVLEILADKVPGVMAVKDDVCGEFARKMCLLVQDKMATFAGGQKQNHLDMYPYGCDGYLSTFISLKPSIAWSYWKAIEKKDLAAAREVIRKYDMPYFSFVDTLPGGFDAAEHGMLELVGIAGRWRRKPYYSFGEEDMARLKAFCEAHSLL
jgi:4-hydroxy-tetrahydrodipicolinate synthase